MARPYLSELDARSACREGLVEYQDSKTGFAEYEDHLRRSHRGHNPNDCFECHDMSLDQHPGNAHDPKRCRICISDAKYYESLLGDDSYDSPADEPERFPDDELLEFLGYPSPIIDETDNWASADDPFGPPQPRGIQDFAQNLDA